MSRLNNKRSIWIEQKDLGKNIVIRHKSKRYAVKIPPKINRQVIIRLRGLGNTKDNKTGDLILKVHLNKGDDVRARLWLSDTSALTGAKKILSFEERKIQISIPPKSHNGLVIRLRDLGRQPSFNWRAPLLRRKRGDLLVSLSVFPNSITPKYESFETLTTDNMALEGWVYRKRDEVIRKMGESCFTVDRITADTIADRYNEYGWKAIFYTLVRHLQLTLHNINIETSDSISLPGNCQVQKVVSIQGNVPVAANYLITINAQFLGNPFSVAAIIAHELCHVVYSERIQDRSEWVIYRVKNKKDSLEEERIVDLLVFMYKIGEFQLRVARDKRLTLGYFNQDIFERMQVIVSKK